MLFSLEALNAAHGDSLLLHWRAKAGDSISTALVDGGPTLTWQAALRPRLDQLIVQRGGRLKLPFLMVSHIDDDHVGGLVKLFEWLDSLSSPRKFDLETLWLNSFGALTVGRAATAGSSDWPAEDALTEELAALAVQSLASSQGGVSRDAAAILTSIKQGAQLAGYAKKLRILGNSGEDLLLRPADSAKLMQKRFGELVLTVLAPGEEDLGNLRKDWKKKLAAIKKKAATAKPAAYAELLDYVDKSINNLSSIVVLAEVGGRKMLLTGDARGDSILTGLKKGGFLKNKPLKVDLLKMPHHGSWRNMHADFFDAVKADYYVFSADGKYDNPDEDTLNVLLSKRPDDHFTIVMTNESRGRKAWLERKRIDHGRKFKLEVREDPQLSISVNLGTERL